MRNNKFLNARLPLNLDEAYLRMAEVWSKRSKARRLQVAALIVKEKQIISDGYNGMPHGAANDVCEEWLVEPGVSPNSPDGITKTRPDVLHAESNAITKLARNGGMGADGATMYVTHSPCQECAKLIIQAGIKRVVYRDLFRKDDGLQTLKRYGVVVEHLPATVYHGT